LTRPALALVLLLAAPLCLAEPRLDIEYEGRRWGTDGLGSWEMVRFGEDLRVAGEDLEAFPVLATGDSLTGSMYSATGDIHGQALVSMGYLRGIAAVGGAGDASAGVLGEPFFGDMYAVVYPDFHDDTVVINAPGMAGQAGSFTARFSVDMNMLVDGFVLPEEAADLEQEAMLFAEASFRLDINGVTVIYNAWQSLDNAVGGGGSFNDFPDGPVQVTVPFVYGDPFRIRGQISLLAKVSAGSQGFAQGKALAEFPGSFRWQGMEGLPASATVQGVIDWSQPASVPEGEAGTETETETEVDGSGTTSGGGGPIGWLLLLALPVMVWRRIALGAGLS
jgi:hypothetical protein